MTNSPVPSATVPAESVPSSETSRPTRRLRILSAAAPLLVFGLLLPSTLLSSTLQPSTESVATIETAVGAVSGTAVQDDDKKKRKKQRGKVVRATVVPSTPAAEADPAAGAETATEAESATPTDPKAAKKAEKEARQKAKQEAAERDRAAREADRARDEEEQATERAAKREAEQAQEKADSEAARQRSADRATDKAAAKEVEREARAARSATKSEASAQNEAKAMEAKAAATRTTPAPSSASAAVAPERPAPAPVATPTEPVRTAPAPTPKREATATVTTKPAPSASGAIAPAAATPKTDRRPDVSESIQVREVLLDVLVTDRKGNAIEGLDKSAFQVTEDGKEVEVTSLVYYGGTDELKSAGIEETRTDRYFILFFHDQAQAAPFLRAAQMDNGRWAQKWIETELQPNDQVAVLGYDVRLKVYQDFSTDPVILSQAVSAAVRGRNEPDRWRTREADPARDGSPSLLINLPTGKALSRETRRLQTALELVGRASEGIIGRKNLMLFSAGFGEIDDIGVWTPDLRYYPPMKESLNTGNVAVYSIDILGARRGTPGARDINDGLSALSTDTGGHYYSTFANALTPLRNVSEDNLGYYLLSYRSEFEAGTTGYREVKVKVDNPTTGKKLKVKARKGYRFGT